MERDYDRERGNSAWLTGHLQETQKENKALKGAAANYERVKRVFGPEEVERAVEEERRREAAEREQKRKAKRRFDRGAR